MNLLTVSWHVFDVSIQDLLPCSGRSATLNNQESPLPIFIWCLNYHRERSVLVMYYVSPTLTGISLRVFAMRLLFHLLGKSSGPMTAHTSENLH